MQRYFIDGLNESGQVIVSGEDYHHIVKVMRQDVGGQFFVVVHGQTAIAEIVEVCSTKLVATICKWVEAKGELPVPVTLACGLTKGDKLELVVQKCTELGAVGVIPWQAERSIVKWDQSKVVKKVARLQKIAKEAAEQSHRSVVPEVKPLANLQQLIEQSRLYDVKLVAFEESAREGEISTFAKCLQGIGDHEHVLIVFGPEGGLNSLEIEQMLRAGFQLCGLGPRILRAETAPLFAMAAIGYEFELRK